LKNSKKTTEEELEESFFRGFIVAQWKVFVLQPFIAWHHNLATCSRQLSFSSK